MGGYSTKRKDHCRPCPYYWGILKILILRASIIRRTLRQRRAASWPHRRPTNGGKRCPQLCIRATKRFPRRGNLRAGKRLFSPLSSSPPPFMVEPKPVQPLYPKSILNLVDFHLRSRSRGSRHWDQMHRWIPS